MDLNDGPPRSAADAAAGDGGLDAPPRLPRTRSAWTVAVSVMRSRLHLWGRRWRASTRLYRVDAPTRWRMVSHSAVLVLSIGVFMAGRWSQLAAQAAELAPDSAQSEVSWAAQFLGEETRQWITPGLVPDTVTTSRAPARVDAPDYGFMSPGVVAEADPNLLPWDTPQRHVLQNGETISGIANAFGIDVVQLMRFNPEIRKDPHNVPIGTELTVLPFDGVVHVVADGDTLESVAQKYEVAPDAIVAFDDNQLQPGDVLAAGARIVVPGGKLEIAVPSYFDQFQQEGAAATWAKVQPGSLRGTGTFHIAAFGRMTNGYHRGHWAADLANRTGTPIYAIDSGTVTMAGWYSWAGNAVFIDHGNGYVSLYAHMNSIGVSAGQQVQRGQIIGTIGCTRGRGGRCTGPHLHLEVTFNGQHVNPCSLGACY